MGEGNISEKELLGRVIYQKGLLWRVISEGVIREKGLLGEGNISEKGYWQRVISVRMDIGRGNISKKVVSRRVISVRITYMERLLFHTMA